MIDKKQLRLELLADLKLGVAAVLANEIEEYDALGVSPSEIDTYLLSVGFTKKGYIETNGWEYDYYMEYTKDNKLYVVSGSGYYGGMTFRIEED